MTRQEEIRQGLRNISTEIGGRNGNVKMFLSPDVVNQILAYLNKEGAVLKAERELPYSVEDSYVSPEAMETIKKAGYVTVEPLIEEEK